VRDLGNAWGGQGRIRRRRGRSLFAALFATAFLSTLAATASAQPVYDVEVVAEYPHDPGAYTQGLFFADGFLYESTGINGRSSLRKVKLETGEVVQRTEFPVDVFGEGIAPWKDTIIGLTWIAETGFVFDLKTFAQKRSFAYRGEGWGLTSDGSRLIMSDGTAELRFLDPETLREIGRLQVTHKGRPLTNLNELEWIEGTDGTGEIFANVWLTDMIVRIDEKSGAVIGVIDARLLRARLGAAMGIDDVLNGIAWDAKSNRLFVTGKHWPKLFEVRLRERR